MKSNEVDHNIAVDKVPFLEFLKHIRKPLAQWLQYKGFEVEGSSRLIFIFKSSQNSLTFKVYAGVYKGEEHATELRIYVEKIYEFFKALKYENLND